MHLQRALGTEFLTAEASDTLFAVDLRLVVFHCDRLGGTDPEAFAATHTFASFQLGSGCHTGAEKRTHKSTLESHQSAEKFDIVRAFDVVKIGYDKPLKRAVKKDITAIGTKSAFAGKSKGRNLFLVESDKLGTDAVAGVA